MFEASNALEAVAIFAETSRIDAVITDVDMPGALNGFDLVDLVSAGGKPMAKIMMFGLASEGMTTCHPAVDFLANHISSTT